MHYFVVNEINTEESQESTDYHVSDREVISDQPTDREDISDQLTDREDISNQLTDREDISNQPTAPEDISDQLTDRKDISDQLTNCENNSHVSFAQSDAPLEHTKTYLDLLPIEILERIFLQSMRLSDYISESCWTGLVCWTFQNVLMALEVG